MTTLEQRIQACEESNAKLRKQLGRQRLMWAFTTLLVAGGGAIAGGSLKQASFDRISVKEIVVVDGKGVVRTRVSGDLPDGVMANGHVAKRGSKAAGVMLYDEQGIERGGYVTQDEGSNVMLTLDSKHRQSTLFVAGPDEDQASALRLWSKAGSIELRSDPNGARLSFADQKGVFLQQPVVALTPATCTDYKKLEQQYPGKRICESRFTESACKVCMEQP